MSSNHQVSDTDKNLRFGFVLNTGFTIFEFSVGLLSGSLALVADAAHNLTDSLSIVVSWGGERLGQRKADTRHTFGHGGAAVIAALINTSILLGLAVFIFVEAFKRFSNPEPVEGGLVAVVAGVGIVINGLVALRFARDRANINIRSAFLNMALDALASAGALLAGLLIVVTGKSFFDPLISLVIGVLLLTSAASIIKRAAHILLQGVPGGIDAAALKQIILDYPGVKGVDDLHVWGISATQTGLSCHLVISPKTRLADAVQLVSRIKTRLANDFRIVHSTIEIQLGDGPHDGERTDEGL